MGGGGGHELRWISTTHPASRMQRIEGTPGTGVFKIEQQPLGQEIWGEALEMWGIDALKDSTADVWKERLQDYTGAPEQCERGLQERTKAAFMGPQVCIPLMADLFSWTV